MLAIFKLLQLLKHSKFKKQANYPIPGRGQETLEVSLKQSVLTVSQRKEVLVMEQCSLAVVLSILLILSLNIRCLCVLVSHLNSHFSFHTDLVLLYHQRSLFHKQEFKESRVGQRCSSFPKKVILVGRFRRRTVAAGYATEWNVEHRANQELTTFYLRQ